MSPRRSSRARTTQPSTSHPSQTLSSSSSTSSGRADRSTRSHHKNQSSQKSTPPRSRSSEEDDEASRIASSEPLQTRRRKREREDDEELDRDISRTDGQDVQGEEDEEEEEEEITRCVCGNQEYPGAPVPITTQSIEADADPKSNIKDEANPDSSITTSDVPSDEYGGLFIQCDMCKVWQHGGCVGIWDQSTSPDEYFCEQCRRDLHRITIGMNGQRFSRYVPALEASSPKPLRSTSQSKDRESKASSNNKSNRPSTGSGPTKRRSTMNSRDAAYDAEVQLRKAIEESERDGKGSENLDTFSRRGKRGRSDSEEKDHESKRQRTTSNSPSPLPGPTHHTNSRIGDSDDDAPSNKNSVSSGGKRIRGAASRNHREKEPRDREKEKEKERADAAGRRKGRAERRRGDDSDPSDEFPLSRTASTKGIIETASQLLEPPVSSQPPPNTPPTNNTPPVTSTSNSHRKTGRPPARRGRVGRNQYTKDRDLHNDAVTGENGVAASPNRSQSRDGPPLDDGPTANAHVNGNHHSHSNGQGPVISNDGSKPSKPRYMHPQRTTMNEMKRRVAAILEFISRTQVEMAGEHTPPTGGSSSSMTTATVTALRGISEALPGYLMVNGNSSGLGGEERDFGEMTSLEMMDILTRKLVLWQKEFGKYGEK
ncbi:hypothetical protein FGG08_004717 [Glutinoglossum americanum]|uniref:Zinc finger PHD-type domain-containing protein n=1 Tax=Glutinoglossum americanum TaxID=1670608 RepID=A0A9P8I534_9PEZI|nr:hypothetical protein FGG08_004717 [Glutinoglossum americanum]